MRSSVYGKNIDGLKLKFWSEVKELGEITEFNPGDKAPNNGTYIETGENDFHMGINDPRQIELKNGEHFPATKNKNRKWIKKHK